MKISEVITDLRGQLSQAALYPAVSILTKLGLITDEKIGMLPRRFFLTPKGGVGCKEA